MKITNYFFITIQISSFGFKIIDTKSIKFDKSNEYINCGVEHKMFGISIVDNNLHQFENCTAILYNNYM